MVLGQSDWSKRLHDSGDLIGRYICCLGVRIEQSRRTPIYLDNKANDSFNAKSNNRLSIPAEGSLLDRLETHMSHFGYFYSLPSVKLVK